MAPLSPSLTLASTRHRRTALPPHIPTSFAASASRRNNFIACRILTSIADSLSYSQCHAAAGLHTAVMLPSLVRLALATLVVLQLVVSPWLSLCAAQAL